MDNCHKCGQPQHTTMLCFGCVEDAILSALDVQRERVKALVDALQEYAAPSNWTAENHLVSLVDGVPNFEVIWTYHGHAPEHDEKPWEPAAVALIPKEDR